MKQRRIKEYYATRKSTQIERPIYRTIRPTISYSSDCWDGKKQYIHKRSIAKMKMLRWMCGKTIKDHIRNDCIRNKVGHANIEYKLQEV